MIVILDNKIRNIFDFEKDGNIFKEVSFREEFNNFPFESVAFPRGVKGMKKYSDASQIYKKGTPIHVKGSLIFNNLLKLISVFIYKFMLLS